VTNPSSPTLASTYNTPGSVNGVGVAGDLALVGDGASGLQVLNITNPASPTLINTYDTPGNASGVALAGEHAFVGDGGSGLQVVAVTAVGSPTLISTYYHNPEGVFDNGDGRPPLPSTISLVHRYSTSSIRLVRLSPERTTRLGLPSVSPWRAISRS
jgi:hypothetical protein